MEKMEIISEIARKNTLRARAIIDELDIYGAWRSIGAETRQVGSLRMGLMMKHRDIDFHIYSSPLSLSDSFTAMARIAENPHIENIECRNSINTKERCIEWHAFYRDKDNDIWQIDMIHIERGSQYDGYFEHVADRISEVLTDKMRSTILRLKYETPDSEKIAGIEYYRAVIEGGVATYDELSEWRHIHPLSGVDNWIP